MRNKPCNTQQVCASIAPVTRSDTASTGVQSVERALVILDILARSGEAGVTSLAHEIGVHKSTALRLVATLEQGGLVEQTADRGKYRLGVGVLRLAGATAARLDVVTEARPICRRLASDTGETINIAVLSDHAALYVDQVAGSSTVQPHNWVGQRIPLHATSNGKVLLGWAPESELADSLRDLDRYTDAHRHRGRRAAHGARRGARARAGPRPSTSSRSGSPPWPHRSATPTATSSRRSASPGRPSGSATTAWTRSSRCSSPRPTRSRTASAGADPVAHDPHHRIVTGEDMASVPNSARVVVIGAGIVGNSLVYHLARLGWRDIVQIDKGPLPNPGGSTGHASNFIFPVDHSREITDLTLDSMRQYKEMGVFTESGGIEVARSEERMQELQRRMSSAKAWGIPSEMLTPEQVAEKVPFLESSVILGGFYTPSVGVVDSLRAGTIMRERALEMDALTVVPNAEVTGMTVEDGRITAVRTSSGDIETECVVIACGVWSPKLARMAGAHIPLTPAVHQMISVGPVPQLAEKPGEITLADRARHGHVLLRAPARQRHGGRLLRPPADPHGAGGDPVHRAGQAVADGDAVHRRGLRPAAGAGARAHARDPRPPRAPRSATPSTACSR